MPYIPHSEEDIVEMLESVGVESYEKLFASIPLNLRSKSFDLPVGLSEFDLFEKLKNLSSKNTQLETNFLGAGYYNHYIPAAVDSITSLPEFYTAYTPYQPEASQGWLQAIFEYQTAMCELTGMDVSNASMYDGTTALVEAVYIALRSSKKNKVLVSSDINFIYKNVLKTYAQASDFNLVESAEIADSFDDQTAAVIIQNPDFFGRVYDYTELITKAHKKGIIVIMSVYPISLGILKTPAEMGADLVIAEGQCLGNHLGFGGPYLGILCSTDKYARKLPGRIVGQAVDSEGKQGFVLTLQAREQHIRREKATSNICSNQALCALRALVYMLLLGGDGFKNLAIDINARANDMRDKLNKISGIEISSEPIFNEFVVKLPISADSVVSKMLEQNIMPGLPLSVIDDSRTNELLVSVTEKISIKEIDCFINILKGML